MNEDLISELTLVQSVINAIPAPIFFKDHNGIYLGCNVAFTQFVGRTFDQIIGKGVFELWDDDLAQKYFDADAALLQAGGKQCYEAQVTYADGVRHNVMFHKANFIAIDDNIRGIVGVMLDITAQKKTEKELLKLVNLDTLTGLFNRHYLYESLEQAQQRCRRNNSGMAVLFLDIDGFKAVNDAHGHAIGDKLLIEVATLLQQSAADNVVSRFGGDEFVIIMEDLKTVTDCELLAQKIIDAVTVPMFVDGLKLQVGMSVGISTYGVEQLGKQDLLINADRGLYQAKSRGKGQYAVFY